MLVTAFVEFALLESYSQSDGLVREPVHDHDIEV